MPTNQRATKKNLADLFLGRATTVSAATFEGDLRGRIGNKRQRRLQQQAHKPLRIKDKIVSRLFGSEQRGYS